MAIIPTTPVRNQSYRTVTLAADATIIGVRLAKSIPQGEWLGASPAAGAEEEGVKVRPTNVTATIGTAANAEPDYILLHNGPAGGYTQQAHLAMGTYRVNAVVTGIMTNA